MRQSVARKLWMLWGVIVNLAVAVVIAGGAAFYSYQYWVADIPPHKIGAAWADPSELIPGQPLHVRVRVFVTRLCKIDVKWAVTDSKTSLQVTSGSAPGKANQLGDSVVDNTRILPALPPGIYIYQSTVYDKCSESEPVYVAVTPKVYFTISEPTP